MDYNTQLCSSLTCEPKSTNHTFVDPQNSNNSESDSDDSYSDLINDYTSSKLKAELQNNVDANKISGTHDLDNRQRSRDTDNPSTPSCSGSDENDHSTDKRNTFLRKSSDRSLKDDFSCVGCVVVPQSYVVKWGAQLLVALERLHRAGVICL